MKRNIHSLGFSILEMLVVLMIVGFISSILFEALDQVYKLQSRFGLQLAQSQQGAMYTDWFRQVVQGLQTDFPDGKEKFKGSESEFAGVTTSPLSTRYGSPVAITLSLKYDRSENLTTLLYSDNANKMNLFSWSGKKAGRFIYVDAAGEQHDDWPPPFGIWPQLPNTIFLQSQNDGEPQLISAVPRGTRDAKIRQVLISGAPP
jgi:general secretion pathway protein J